MNESEIETNQKDFEAPPHGHWQLFRDLLAFQFKLALDAGRDLLLSPVSVIVTIAGLITHQDDPGKHFYRLLQIGHKSDRWINLFGTGEGNGEDHRNSSDTYVRKVEELVVNEYHKGGVIKNMKDKADGLIEKIKKD